MADGLNVFAMAVQDFGVDAQVGGKALRVLDCLSADAAIEAGYVDIDGPFVLASQQALEALDIKYGDDGELLTIAGEEYVVKHIKPDAMGMALIMLGKLY